LLEELRHRGVPCVRWNLDRFPVGSGLTFRAANDHFLTEIATDGRTLRLDDIGSIWCRGFRPAGFPVELTAGDRAFALTESQRAIDALLTVGPALWVNHPAAHARANAKPAQLAVARQVGFEIPRTVITNDPAEARAFAAQNKQGTVYKAMSQSLALEHGKALFTGLLGEEELASLDLIRVSPGIFQELVPKAYEVRTTVVGDRTFSGRIDSQARPETRVDWRHRPFDMNQAAIELPPDVEAKVHAFMHAFGLYYGAFDFIVTPDGRWVFLEVNPAGQYMWVETTTQLPITLALVDLLTRAL
jgi:glutathione synthase/RimK-type ligase-like ATP-grasp enzyme